LQISLPEETKMTTAARTGLRGLRVDRAELTKNPSYQAYQLLHLTFVVAPVIAGLDKFFHLLVNWEVYVAPFFQDILGGARGTRIFMVVVGFVEIFVGLIVALRPRIGAYVVAAWLAAIIVNLVIAGGYLDIALRDLGLFLSALAFGRLAMIHDTTAAKRA
jgi:hypothetical protein